MFGPALDFKYCFNTASIIVRTTENCSYNGRPLQKKMQGGIGPDEYFLKKIFFFNHRAVVRLLITVVSQGIKFAMLPEALCYRTNCLP